MGLNGYSGEFFEYGSAANGNRWRIVFDVIEKDRLQGELRAGAKDGGKGEGRLEIVRVNDDKYTASWSITFEDGTTRKGEVANTRK